MTSTVITDYFFLALGLVVWVSISLQLIPAFYMIVTGFVLSPMSFYYCYLFCLPRPILLHIVSLSVDGFDLND